MKKITNVILTLVLLILSYYTKAQIISIPDSNFKAKLLSANLTNGIALDALNRNIKIDINGDNEIQTSEALRVYRLNVGRSSIYSLSGISFFTNLKYLDCLLNQLSSLDVSNLSNLNELECRNNQIVDLNINNLINLKSIVCAGNKLTNLNLSSLANLEGIYCSYNLITSMNLNGLTKLQNIDCAGNKFSQLEIKDLPKLQSLFCADNKELQSLRLSNLPVLGNLYCHSCDQLFELSMTNLPKLSNLDCFNCSLQTLNLSDLTALRTINCSNNQISDIDISSLVNLDAFNCSNNQLSTLNVSNLIKLTSLRCSDNLLTSLDVHNLKDLITLYCPNNLLSTINVTGLNILENLYFANNQMTNIDLSSLSNLLKLSCSSNQFTTLNTNGLVNLKELDCSHNQLTQLDVSALSNLQKLTCNHNALNQLTTHGLHNLYYIYCNNNELTSLDISTLNNLTELYCFENQLNDLNVNDLSYLYVLICNNNNLRSLDLTDAVRLTSLNCEQNKLTSIYMKDKNWNVSNYYFDNNPDLRYICADDYNVDSLYQKANRYGYTNIVINTLCSTTLYGTHYSLNGNIKLDIDNNGCSLSDPTFPNAKISIVNPIDSGYAIADSAGNFAMELDSGSYVITPKFNNNYFVCSPISRVVNFPEDTISQQFCITPNGTHHDVSVTLIPIRDARPGFSDATYLIVLTNKGNQLENATISFNCNESVQDYISAVPSPFSELAGQISFSINNLQLFETREILVTMRTNAPTDVPSVNVGDVLVLSASANINADENLDDNMQQIKQTVLGSIDPNDKTCLEGNIATPDIIGDFVNYLIRFENTGTANAENVVVTDFIDLAKFDISSLELTSTSHSCKTLISNGNKVQFVFDNINLAFTDPDKYGYVAFKIKTKSNLAVGDSLKNNADIYFDYNLPIKTNTATTKIENLILGIKNTVTKNGSLQVYPNPSNGNFTINFESKGTYPISIKVMDLKGSIVLEKNLYHSEKTSMTIDESNLSNGIYLINITSGKDNWLQKLMIVK
jgi:uncharacterized repeat protein (TIGR01451 family)